MRLLADLHTHTVASRHAYSTVTEIAVAAAQRGLELVAITDHGPDIPGGAHPWHFWNAKMVPDRICGVRVIKGVEANPSLSSDNGLDLPDDLLAMLDIVSVGLHAGLGLDDRDERRNTEALLRAMENPYVDMVTHPGNVGDYPVDMDRIVASALEHGVILELNACSFDPRSGRYASRDAERAFAQASYDAGVPIAIGSDAHYHTDVGNFSGAREAAEELGFSEERIVSSDAESAIRFLRARRERPWMAGDGGDAHGA